MAAVEIGVGAFGGIDAVVAGAGIASSGSVLHVDPSTFRRVIEINITGVFHTVRAALPHLIERRGYALVVSSMAAYGAIPGSAAYSTSKAGIEHFANALRFEVAHQGVAVGSAHMSWIDTPMVRDGRRDVPTFNDVLTSLPRPLSKVVSLEECVDCSVSGIRPQRSDDSRVRATWRRASCHRHRPTRRGNRPTIPDDVSERVRGVITGLSG